MKRVIFVLLCSINIANAQIPEVHLASDIWPPFTDVGEKNAFAIDLVDEALKRTGLKVDTDITEFEGVMEGIANKSYDGSAALWISDERKETMLFSEPYLQNQLVLVGKKESDVSFESLSQLTGKTVAIVGSYAYGDSVSNLKNVTFIPGLNDQENMKRLLDGEVDYILVDALLIHYLLMYQEEEAKEHLAIGQKPLITRSLHFALRNDVPHAEEIIKRFNSEINEMVADGTYNTILHINWVQADINGDGIAEMVLSGSNAGEEAPMGGYALNFQNSNLTSDTASNRYYIEGRLYEKWEDVPGQYKVAPAQHDPSEVGIFKFSFN